MLSRVAPARHALERRKLWPCASVQTLILRLALGGMAATACGADAQSRTRGAVSGGASGQARQTPALPACEWCGAPEAPAALGAEARLAGPEEPGTPLVVSGTVYRPGGRVPAPGVLLYAYHTNARGIYPKRGDETGNGRRHGYLRGWLRTDARGRYRLVTIRPAMYPTRAEPAHIHLTVTPPGCAEDYVDSILFDDDPLLTRAQRARLAGRGGSGVVRAAPVGRGGLQATRDIVLAPGACVDTLWADLGASVVHWKGTKFGGRGKHEGVVRLASGRLLVRDGAVVAGTFAADLRTIAVTDIPPDDSVPRRRIREHLMSPDFFDVARHPRASFAITNAERVGARRFRLAGTLTMRGVTRPVAFPAEVVSYGGAAGDGTLRAGGRLRLDRRQWGMTYRGSRLANLLVDDEIMLDLVLVARPAPRHADTATTPGVARAVTGT